jgi:hypothetical protein
MSGEYKMIVNRRTFVVKGGRTDDAKVLTQESLRAKPIGMTRPLRWYVIEFGPWDHLALETEFETLAEYERLTAEWLANLSPEFWKRWNEVMTIGGSNELWTLVE